MTKADARYWLVCGVAAALLLLFIGNCARVFATCDGHVVKNVFDWPVCVK